MASLSYYRQLRQQKFTCVRGEPTCRYYLKTLAMRVYAWMHMCIGHTCFGETGTGVGEGEKEGRREGGKMKAGRERTREGGDGMLRWWEGGGRSKRRRGRQVLIYRPTQKRTLFLPLLTLNVYILFTSCFRDSRSVSVLERAITSAPHCTRAFTVARPIPVQNKNSQILHCMCIITHKVCSTYE